MTITDQGQVTIQPPKTTTCLNCNEENPMTAFNCTRCGNFITTGVSYDPQDDGSFI